MYYFLMGAMFYCFGSRFRAAFTRVCACEWCLQWTESAIFMIFFSSVCLFVAVVIVVVAAVAAVVFKTLQRSATFYKVADFCGRVNLLLTF